MDLDLRLETADHDGWTVLAVAGEVDAYTAPQLRERLAGLAADGRSRVIVDLSGVEFIDSSALGALVAGMRQFEGQGSLMVLCCAQPRILKVLEIAGLTKVFTVYDDLETALAS